MSNLLLLIPQQVDFVVGTKEDWIDAIAFTNPDGTPCALTGIAFTFDIGYPGAPPLLTGGTGNGMIVTTGGLLAFDVAQASNPIPAGKYQITVVGADGTNTRDVVVGSYTAREDV